MVFMFVCIGVVLFGCLCVVVCVVFLSKNFCSYYSISLIGASACCHRNILRIFTTHDWF